MSEQKKIKIIKRQTGTQTAERPNFEVMESAVHFGRKTEREKHRQTIFFEERQGEVIDVLSCYQIREKLDALFDGTLPLEETPAGIKRSLFGHLEICSSCCRALDVRVRFRPMGRARIY